MLRAAFTRGISIEETAAHHQRTRGAIRSRLVKLELITSDGEPIEVREAPQIDAAESVWLGEELARLRLSPRLAAALASLDVRTIDDFALVTSKQLIQVPGIRRRTVRELAWWQERLKADSVSAASKPTDELGEFLDEVDASVRLRRAVEACRLATVEEFFSLNPAQLLKIPAVGRTTVLELERIRQGAGLPPFAAIAARSEIVPTPEVVQTDASPADAPLSASIKRIDQLIRDLCVLRSALLEDSSALPRVHAEVMRSFARFDDAALQLVIRVAPEAQGNDEREPIPDRLRKGLADLVSACVPNQKDRYVAIQLLGLDGDGQPLRLSDVGEVLGVSRERVRQRREKAFSQVRAAARRRVASCQRLRAVLRAISAEADWTDPEQAASHLIKLLPDKVSVVEELTLMCCLATGWSGAKSKELAQRTRQAVITECKKASEEGRWRLDVWIEATRRAIFPSPATRFDSFPADLVARKREPGENRDEEALYFHSEKLGREVACESGTEYKVMAWLEQTPEIVWYQEQPLIVPYLFHGRNRRYYPDVAALDREGRCYVIEVKPIYGMYRETTLAKALACLDYVRSRGMAYLLVDQRGRTVADYASVSYDTATADEIDTLIDELGRVRFPLVRAVFEDHLGKISTNQFISMTLNRGWSVTEAPGVTVGRLTDGLSFRPLIDHLPRW